MKDNDNIINNNHRVDTDGHLVNVDGHYVDAHGRVVNANERVVAQHIIDDPDYFEVGDRERIIDDNARRMGEHGVVDRTVVTNDPSMVGRTATIHDSDRVDRRVVSSDLGNIDRTEVKHMSKESRDDLNADMITGEPGSHPIGTGIGGVGGAAAGAAIGSMAGPLGTLIGGAIGAIVGGGAGHASAEAINPTHEEAYWRAEHANASYYRDGHEFDRDLHPAYAVGYANRARYPADARFEDHETDLRRSWEEVKGESRMEWEEARLASRDAWHRVS